MNREAAIGNLHWHACETCKHGNPAGGCLVEDRLDFKVDYVAEIVTCTEYEQE